MRYLLVLFLFLGLDWNWSNNHFENGRAYPAGYYARDPVLGWLLLGYGPISGNDPITEQEEILQ